LVPSRSLPTKFVLLYIVVCPNERKLCHAMLWFEQFHVPPIYRFTVTHTILITVCSKNFRRLINYYFELQQHKIWNSRRKILIKKQQIICFEYHIAYLFIYLFISQSYWHGNHNYMCSSNNCNIVQHYNTYKHRN
jgi:hypothetical protein